MQPHFWGLGIETEHISLVCIPVNSFRAKRPLQRHSYPTFQSLPGVQRDSQVGGLSNKCYGKQEALVFPLQAPFCNVPCWNIHCLHSSKHMLSYHQLPACWTSCCQLLSPSLCHVPGPRQYPLPGLTTAGHTCTVAFLCVRAFSGGGTLLSTRQEALEN